MLCGVPGTAFVAVILNVILPGRNLKKQSLEDQGEKPREDERKALGNETTEENLMGVEVDVSNLEAPKAGEAVSPIDFEAAKRPDNEKR